MKIRSTVPTIIIPYKRINVSRNVLNIDVFVDFESKL